MPARQAVAVGVGLFIGCTPLYGLHFALTGATAWLLGLNPLLVYAAANISNPLAAPFLLALEWQVGAWFRRQVWLGPQAILDSGLGEIAADLVVGSALVGVVGGLIGGSITYVVLRRRALHPAITALLERTALRYLSSGWMTWEAANGKLRLDRVYLDVLKHGRLPARGTLVDLGCGRGLMLALLATARELYAEGVWPPGWPAPPAALELRGVEARPRMVAQAERALGAVAAVGEHDIRQEGIPPCDVVLLFDVLHLMADADQRDILQRIAEALRPGGLLVLREADGEAGWRFQIVRWSNWVARAVQGRWERHFHFRSVGQWRRQLEAAGFTVEVTPAGRRTLLANVVLYARRAAPQGGTADPGARVDGAGDA